MATFRHIALNLLKQEKATKVGIKSQCLKAGWDDSYPLAVLYGYEALALSELRHYIDDNGGNVVSITSLGFAAGGNVVAIKPGTLSELKRRFSRAELERLLYDYDIAGKLEALTERQARAILRFGTLDA